MNRRVVLLGALLIGVMLGMSAVLVAAQGDESTPTPAPTRTYSSVSVAEAFLRGGPGLDYLTIGSLLQDERLTPLNLSADGEWVLVVYRGGFGWLRRDLAVWVERLDRLPILGEGALTPTVIPGSETATPRLVTLTPVGNYVLTTRSSVLVRSGPGMSFSRVGALDSGATVEPYAVDETGTWVLIRYIIPLAAEDFALGTLEPEFDGFGWVAANLVLWLDDLSALPIMYDDALTPSVTWTATFTPSETATATLAPSETATATATFTPSETATATEAIVAAAVVPSDTATLTPSETATNTESPTETETATLTPSETATATFTPSETATETLTPSETATATFTPSETATETLTPSETATATFTPSETETATLAPSETATATFTPSETATATEAIVAAAVVPSDTATLTPSETATNTESPTETETATLTPSETATNTESPSETPTETAIPPTEATDEPAAILAVASPPQAGDSVESAPDAPQQTVVVDDESVSFPAEILIGGAVFGLIVAYVGFYLRGFAAVNRYKAGFVLETCPVCDEGHLHVDTRTEHTLGIPHGRHIVRCDHCRSILRETAPHTWRYAVDPLENEAMYKRYNGEELSERDLQNLLTESRGGKAGAGKPSFVEGDE